jgi:hypothetical protein
MREGNGGQIAPTGGCHQEKARRDFRNALRFPSGRRCSTSWCVVSHTFAASTSKLCPFAVRVRMRLLWSAGSGVTLMSPRRSSGFSAAVKVVRSIASREATGPIDGGSGRFRDISRENCPLVSPKGRNTSSKRRPRVRAARCTWRQRQQSLTSIVVSYGSVFLLDTPQG